MRTRRIAVALALAALGLSSAGCKDKLAECKNECAKLDKEYMAKCTGEGAQACKDSTAKITLSCNKICEENIK